MNIETLREYLFVFSKEGYSRDPGTKNQDGSMTIHHVSEDKEWSIVDTYWGGEPYAGCETVCYKGKPAWSMVYYGTVHTSIDDVKKVYGHLRNALSNTDETFPLRGPLIFEEGDMKYANNWHGDLTIFNGEERILNKGTEVYTASYMGGLVNQRDE